MKTQTVALSPFRQIATGIICPLLLAGLIIAIPMTASVVTAAQQEDEKEREQPQPVRTPPGGFLDLGGEGGPPERQPVGEPKAELTIAIHPQSDEAEVGKTFRFSVVVMNEGVNRANNVSLQVSAERRVPQTQAQTAPVPLRYESAKVKSGSPPEEKDCTASERTRVCDLGMLAPGKKGEVTVVVGTGLAAQPGEIILSAVAKSAGNDAGSDRKTVRLVPNARAQTNVDLKLTIEDFDVVSSPGSRFQHAITVRNTSNSDDATDIKLQIVNAMRLSPGGLGRWEPYNDGFRAAVAGQGSRCKTQPRNKAIEHNCELGRIGPQKEVRILIEFTIVKELPAGRWGQVKSQARVRSAENDPNRADNTELELTRVISRLPQISFFAPLPGEPERAVPARLLSQGQLVRIKARFQDPSVELYGSEIRARLVRDGAETKEITLRRNTDVLAPDRDYRSELFWLTRPGERPPADAAGAAPLSAPRGAVLKVIYTVPPSPSPKQRLERQGQSSATLTVR